MKTIKSIDISNDNRRINSSENDFLKSVHQILIDNPTMDLHKERKLVSSYKKGNSKAKNILLMANVRFIYSVAKHYHCLFPYIPLGDMFSECFLGAEQSLNTYNEKKGIRFISWSSGYIRTQVLKYIKDNIKIVKLPQTTFNNSYKFRKLLNTMSVDEAKKSMNLTEYQAGTLFKGEDSDIKRMEDIDLNYNAEDIVIHQEQLEILRKGLHNLTLREKQIIELYFGLGDAESMNAKKISELLQITQQRVKQIIKLSINKLNIYIKNSYRIKQNKLEEKKIVPRNTGIKDAIICFLKNGGTEKECLDNLLLLFPDKTKKSMYKTLYVQWHYRLPKNYIIRNENGFCKIEEQFNN